MPAPSQRQQKAQCYNAQCSSGGKEVSIPLGRVVAGNIYERIVGGLFCGDCGGDLIPYGDSNPLPVPTPPKPMHKPPEWPTPPSPIDLNPDAPALEFARNYPEPKDQEEPKK